MGWGEPTVPPQTIKNVNYTYVVGGNQRFPPQPPSLELIGWGAMGAGTAPTHSPPPLN